MNVCVVDEKVLCHSWENRVAAGSTMQANCQVKLLEIDQQMIGK